MPQQDDYCHFGFGIGGVNEETPFDIGGDVDRFGGSPRQ
jgi:hypothetical protein